MASFKVIIIGAGLAGSLLANGLVKHGVDVTVYERDIEDSKRSGYQIRLGEASMAGMKACLTEDHLARIAGKFGRANGDSAGVAAATTFKAVTLYSRHFRILLDLNKLPLSWYPRTTVINRVTLRDLLLEPLRSSGHIQYEKAFSKYEILNPGTSDEMVKVHFTDGSSSVCDVLVGADGSSSKINHQVGLQNLTEIKEMWCFVCKGGLTEERMRKCPKSLLNGPIIVGSKGIQLYYCFYMPPRPQEDSSADAPTKDWSYYWGIQIPARMIPYEQISDISDKRQFVLDAIKDWAPEFQHMLGPETDSEPSEVSSIVLRSSHNPEPNWRAKLCSSQQGINGKGHPRVWLIGDAIHAMQPTRGMGGGQAMQDTADMLPTLLGLRDRKRINGLLSEIEIAAAVQQYEDTMLPRTSAWVNKSGGAKPVYLDFDGWLGNLLSFLNTFIIPTISLIGRLFS